VSTPETGHKKQPIGIAAFDTLRAEDEDWLLACFIPPNDFELMAGNRSIVVFGESGSGKTALRRALVQRLQYKGKPTHLIVEWHPAPLEPGASADLSAVRQQANQVFAMCATALVNQPMLGTTDWHSIPTTARTTIAWFIRTFAPSNLETHWGEPQDGENVAPTTLLQTITNSSEAAPFPPTPEYIAIELVKALKPLGLEGIWVIADGLEGWAEAEPERLSAGLSNFLSTLMLFERSNFVYKLFVPQNLESLLSASTGLGRRRLDSYYLQWDTSALQSLVERRLALATGIEGFTLARLCDTPATPKRVRGKKTPERKLNLLEWLQAAGGTNPREWLDQIRPLAQYYLEHHLTRPIAEATWRELRRRRPPRFYFDPSKNQIIVGGRQVSLDQVPVKAYAMLRYLVQQGNRVVSKSELYFRGYQGLDKIPNRNEKGFQELVEYEGLIDTNLWRLRQALEPEPSDPVILVTVKGHGVQLNARW
jgi:hypothetical protein